MTPDELLASISFYQTIWYIAAGLAVTSLAMVILVLAVSFSTIPVRYADALICIGLVLFIAATSWLLLGDDEFTYTNKNAPPELRARISEWERMARVVYPSENNAAKLRRYIFVIENYRDGKLEPLIWRKDCERLDRYDAGSAR